MKRIITFFVMAICLVAVDANAQVAKIMLKNGSRSTMFDKDQLASAVENAVDGDTIIFTEGLFKGGVTINKKISLIGTGQTTTISGDITFQMTGTQELSSRFMDGILLNGSINIKSPVKGMTLRKVKCSTAFTHTAIMEDLTMDRCYINEFSGNENYVKSANMINSTFNLITYHCTYVNFMNCILWQIGYGDSFKGNVTNSIVRAVYRYSPYTGSIFTNCLISSGISCESAVLENCYRASQSEIEGLYTDASALVAAGFVGTDGTAVGYKGGQTPFTLEPKGPKITNMELKVDAQNNQLKVTATGTPN